MEPSESSSASKQRWQRKIKLMLFLLSLGCSMAALLTFDYFYSAAGYHNVKSGLEPGPCRIPDQVRHHALKPNCAFIDHWGRDRYEYFTNSLGFRDEKIREVPLADTRPRILLLGASFTEGKAAWRDGYVGMIAARFPQYDFLNAGLSNYSPSNYLNLERILLAKGVEIDEVIVFSDISDVFHEAGLYRDADASGAVTELERQQWNMSSYARWRFRIARRLWLTNDLLDYLDWFLVAHGSYHLPAGYYGDAFDMEMSAWTYRKVDETDSYPAGYAPLGLEGGIARAEAKMTLLWQDLQQRNIPISVVVAPWPAQLAHDTADSRQVRIWREWCEGKCKRFISAFPAFYAAKQDCPPNRPGCWYQNLFVFGDIHYTAAGNALVADAVSKSLEEAPPAKRGNARQTN